MYSLRMKQVDMYRWRIPQKPPKKPYLTRYYMTLEVGRERYPEGEPALECKEVREVYDEGEAPLGISSPPMPQDG
jgi:hypothetical protein